MLLTVAPMSLQKKKEEILLIRISSIILHSSEIQLYETFLNMKACVMSKYLLGK